MFKDIKRGFSYSLGKALFRIGLFFIILVFMMMISSCHIHAATLEMPTPLRSTEVFIDQSQGQNTNLPTVSWGGLSGKNVGGVYILNTIPMQELHIFYDNIASSSSYIEFYFNINQVGFDVNTWVPYQVSNAFVETDNFVYTQCDYVNYQFPDNYNITYKYICYVNKPLTNWNIVVFFRRSIDGYPLWTSTDRVRFSIGTGSNGSIVIDATNQDVVNSVQSVNNSINNQTQVLSTKIDTTHGILRTISSAITSVINAIANIPSLVFNAFSTILNNILNAFTTLWTNLSSAFSTFYNYFDNIISNDEPTSQYIASVYNDFNRYQNSPIFDFITLPISFLTTLINVDPTSCTAINLGSLYGTNLQLPCLGSTISNILGSDLYNIISVIVSGIVYWKLVTFVYEAFRRVITLSSDINFDYEIDI